MKNSKIKLSWLGIFMLLIGVISTYAKDTEDFAYNETLDVNYEEAYSDLDYEISVLNLARTFRGCTERRRVWVWKGWRPKRVWKTVSVACPSTIKTRGPGTTVPPH
ncbi:hypothetical protein N9954_03535 [Maribacter sp.]|nr:hypothetical protein [Maribacter sp.]